MDVEVAPGRVMLLNTVLAAQEPAVAFCVYHTVLGVGVYHSVLGTQLWTQKVELPDVYGMMLVWLVASQTDTVLTKTSGVEVSSHSPHSQHGSVFVTMTGGGVGVSSHSPHSQHGSVLVIMTGGGIDMPSSHSGQGSALGTAAM